MSAKKPNEPQSVDDFILNPYTKRLIRKDSKTNAVHRDIRILMMQDKIT